MQLSEKKCVACEGGIPPLTRAQLEPLLKELSGWTVSGDTRWLSKEFTFADFAGAMRFANAIAAIAEQEGHHPDLQISWGKVIVELTTHALKGLSENDFILAAKVDKVAN